MNIENSLGVYLGFLGCIKDRFNIKILSYEESTFPQGNFTSPYDFFMDFKKSGDLSMINNDPAVLLNHGGGFVFDSSHKDMIDPLSLIHMLQERNFSFLSKDDSHVNPDMDSKYSCDPRIVSVDLRKLMDQRGIEGIGNEIRKRSTLVKGSFGDEFKAFENYPGKSFYYSGHILGINLCDFVEEIIDFSVGSIKDIRAPFAYKL